MKRDLMNATVSYSALTKRIEKLQDDLVATANKRIQIVTDLAAGMPHEEVGQLLGISAARVAQLSRIADPAARQVTG